jgi:hypothetical protein
MTDQEKMKQSVIFWATLLSQEEQQAEPVLLECVTCGTVYADGVPPQVPVQQQAEPVAVYQWRKQGCADWYDGHPDYSDCGGPYETRTLYTTPPQRKPLTINEVEQILAQHDYEIHGDRARYIVRMTEEAHGIRGKV